MHFGATTRARGLLRDAGPRIMRLATVSLAPKIAFRLARHGDLGA